MVAVRRGGTPQPQDITTETDPDTFIAEHEYDFGSEAVAFVTVTLNSIDPDGETVGGLNDYGKIAVQHFAVDGSAADTSFTGTDYISGRFMHLSSIDYLADAPSGVMTDPGDKICALIATPRFFKAAAYIFYTGDGIDTFGGIYAGANHPVANVTFSVKVIA